MNDIANFTIFISGTPGVGKTTISELLKYKLIKSYPNNKVELIKINEFADENNLILGKDEEKGYKIVDIATLNIKINETINENKIFIVEGHLSHLLKGCDFLVVLRLDPTLLKKRLEKRNYKTAKINENLEAEAIGVCSSEAYEIYQDEVNEIDCTDLKKNEILDIILKIIKGNNSYKIGKIDFTEYLLKKDKL